MEVVISDKDKILIVAPHQDDETLGCGGFLAKYGKQCDILLLTDGSLGNVGYCESPKELISVRNNELEKATNLAFVKNIYKLNIKNNELYKNKKIVKQFSIKDYSYVFVPNRHEEQEDHKIVYSIFSSMKRSQKSKAIIYEYEVWTPLRRPSFFLDITDVIDKKVEMIKCYQSQIVEKDYTQSIIGLNKYRGLYNGYEYAEAYSYSGYNEFTAAIFGMLPEFLKELIKKIIS